METVEWEIAVRDRETQVKERQPFHEPVKPIDPSELREAVFLSQRGLRWKEIATKLGTTPYILRKWRRTYQWVLESERQMFLWMWLMAPYTSICHEPVDRDILYRYLVKDEWHLRTELQQRAEIEKECGEIMP